MSEKQTKSGENSKKIAVELELNLFLKKLKHEHSLNDAAIISSLGSISKAMSEKEIMIPISVFDNTELGALETICKYLFEEEGLGYSKIAELLNRDARTIWVTCNNSRKKRQDRLKVESGEYAVPASVLFNRKLSVLEAIVMYLRDTYGLKFREISKLLRRDERNISGFYRRGKKKC